jgi:hypothetical protein
MLVTVHVPHHAPVDIHFESLPKEGDKVVVEGGGMLYPDTYVVKSAAYVIKPNGSEYEAPPPRLHLIPYRQGAVVT